MEDVKSISSKINSARINSTPPALSRTSSLNNTTNIIMATKMFDEDQTSSIFWMNNYNN